MKGFLANDYVPTKCFLTPTRGRNYNEKLLFNLNSTNQAYAPIQNTQIRLLKIVRRKTKTDYPGNKFYQLNDLEQSANIDNSASNLISLWNRTPFIFIWEWIAVALHCVAACNVIGNPGQKVVWWKSVKFCHNNHNCSLPGNGGFDANSAKFNFNNNNNNNNNNFSQHNGGFSQRMK